MLLLAQTEVLGCLCLFFLIALVLLILFPLLIWWWSRREQAAAPAPPPAPARPRPEPVIEAVEVVEVAAVTPPPAPAAPDDLKVIEGVGPKVASLLESAGIVTFAQLAQTDVARLEAILTDAGLRHLARPDTWPEQARLAAAGEMGTLAELQDQLKGGRRA